MTTEAIKIIDARIETGYELVPSEKWLFSLVGDCTPPWLSANLRKRQLSALRHLYIAHITVHRHDEYAIEELVTKRGDKFRRAVGVLHYEKKGAPSRNYHLWAKDEDFDVLTRFAQQGIFPTTIDISTEGFTEKISPSEASSEKSDTGVYPVTDFNFSVPLRTSQPTNTILASLIVRQNLFSLLILATLLAILLVLIFR